MAEFCEVMDNWRRMCNYYDEQYKENCCGHCECQHQFCGAIYDLQEKDDLLALEHTVQAWAAEHPEPVYPTWGDWLAEMGLVCWENNGDGVYSVMVPTLKMCTQIPSDIAEKLDLKPII